MGVDMRVKYLVEIISILSKEFIKSALELQNVEQEMSNFEVPTRFTSFYGSKFLVRYSKFRYFSLGVCLQLNSSCVREFFNIGPAVA
jgi:hypothetical protein